MAPAQLLPWQPGCLPDPQSRRRPSFPALELQFPECKASGVSERNPTPNGLIARALQLGRGHKWTPPGNTVQNVGTWSGGTRQGILLGEAWEPLLMVAQRTSQKEDNGYKKVQRIRMGASPGFATSLWYGLKTLSQELSTTLNLHQHIPGLSPDGCNTYWSLPLLKPLPFFFD